jgi:hypothetical protein
MRLPSWSELLAAVVLLPLAFTFCTSEAAETDPTTETESSALEEDKDVERCKAELEIKRFPALSCFAGTHVPMTVNGKPPDAATLRAGCDKPAGFPEGTCQNYDFIQRFDVGNPDVEAVLFCRQKQAVNHLGPSERLKAYQEATGEEKQKAYEAYAIFDEFTMILHNKKSGKACFFVNGGLKQADGQWLPPVDQPNMTRPRQTANPVSAPLPDKGNAWRTDGLNCTTCHYYGPFLHTQFIQQAAVVPGNKKSVPYFPINQTLEARDVVDVTTDLVEGSYQRCTQCHRMAARVDYDSEGKARGRCRDLDRSIGLYEPMSDLAKSYPHRAWMPFDHGVDTKAEYDQIFGKHIERMRCCCEKPFAKGCKTRKFATSKPEQLPPAPAGRMLPEHEPAPADATDSCL